MENLNLVAEIVDTDGVLRLTDHGAMKMLLKIDLFIQASGAGWRRKSEVTANRILRGIHPGDVVRVQDALVEYHGDDRLTVIHRRWDSDRCELVETHRIDQALTPVLTIRLLLCAALEAHSNAINQSDGAHHAFTGTAYNPASGV